MVLWASKFCVDSNDSFLLSVYDLKKTSFSKWQNFYHERDCFWLGGSGVVVSRNFQDSKCFKVCFLFDFTCSRITNLDNSMGASPGFPVWCLIFFLPELLCNHIMLSKLGQWERIS